MSNLLSTVGGVLHHGDEEEAAVGVELLAADAVVAADGRAVERHGAEERLRRSILRLQADTAKGGAEVDSCQVRRNCRMTLFHIGKK